MVFGRESMNESFSSIGKILVVNMLHLLVLVFILPIDVLGNRRNSVCEDEVTYQMKCQLIKDSMEKVKILYPACRDADEDSTKCGKKETALAHMNLALDTLDGLKTAQDKISCPKCHNPLLSSGPADCSDVLKLGNKKSGVYTIHPRSRINGTRSLKVYCDMKTEGGGWTIIQRRGNFSQLEDFHRGWEDYKKGFGNVERDFWLGNDNIYTLTNQGIYTLRIDLTKNNGEYRYATYDTFWISNEHDSYTMRVRDFIGNLSNDLPTQDKRKFSTKDRQNDGHSPHDACADKMHGAWWYSSDGGCGYANLNGLYIPGIDNRNSAWWWGFTGYRGLFSIEMKIRHKSPEFVEDD